MFNRKEYMKKYLRLYLPKWKEKNKEYFEKYYQENKSTINKNSKDRWKINKSKYMLAAKKWRDENKDKINNKNKIWYDQNKEEYNKKRRDQFKLATPQWATYEYRKEYLKKWQKQKRQKDLLYRINSNISRRIRKDLKRFNLTKKESTQNILPYTMQELTQHIEKQFTPEMNWENMGSTWEIDHSTPCSWAQNEQDIYTLWNLENLRPLIKKENREKQDLFSGDVNNTLNSIGR